MLNRPTHMRRVSAPMLLLLLCACSPALDWREVGIEGGLAATFPCKPSADARMVDLDGVRVRMLLNACRAGEITWAVAGADMADPARVASALSALQAAAETNLGATARLVAPMSVAGMTPNPQAHRVQIRGRLPDGQAVIQEVGYFAKGTWVFQATVMGAQPDAEPTMNFFDNLKFPS